MCYICRADICKEKYDHFCRKPHCKHKDCGECPLFTDAKEDDRRAMQDAGLKAKDDLGEEGTKVDVGGLLEGGAKVTKKKKAARRGRFILI